MGKILVLTEKPSVAKDISKVIKCNEKGKGYFEGSAYIITWALGHLVTLSGPEVYDEKYKTWKMEDLPMLPKKMRLEVIKETSKQFGIVRNLMHRNDIQELIIATDSGREGELVARWIIDKAGFNKPIKRLWISSQTDKAIKEGFRNLKPSREYDNLYYAAQSRAEADWLIGLNVTRALTCKYNTQLSAGRVQTPTLSMIVERENEIKKFTPKDYWSIQGNCNGFKIEWQDKSSGQTRILSQNKADNILSNVKEQMGKIIEIKKESKKELHPLAYDLTELQRDANKIFGYSAKQTLNIMQKLYETHKLLTYPRTDSRYISDDIVPTLPERLKSISVGPYTKFAQNILKNKIHVTNRFVDNSKVTDHHALIPTEQSVDLSSLSFEERNVYDLVVKRFLAVLYPPFEYEQTTVKFDVNGEMFYAKGKTIKSSGWKEIYRASSKTNNDNEENDQELPSLNEGDSVKINSVRLINGKTKPPARYTEATLLSAMEHPGKFVEDKNLRETIESVSGLGTPATRADIIEKLFNTFYVERRGKEIVPTSKGIQLIDLVPADLKMPELTAKWEQELSLISKGKENSSAFISEMRSYASKLVGNVIASTHEFKYDNVTKNKCPDCGKFLLEVNTKNGKMLVCPDRNCGYRKSVYQVSNARCPKCHKKMEIWGEGNDKTFVCTCGYRENLDTFKKRKGSKVNKKEVNNFLRHQNANENINTALADALSKLKF